MDHPVAVDSSKEALRWRYEQAILDRRRAIRLIRHLSRPSVVPSLLILANFAAYVLVALYAGGDFWQRLLGADGLHYSLLRCGGKANGLIEEGEVWRLLSTVFLHGSLLHLFVNSVGIYYLGKFAENVFGMRRVLLLYVLSGVGATATSVALSSALSVGASGAVFGLLGGVGVYLLRVRDQLPRTARRVLVVAPLLWVAFNLTLGWFVDDVDNAAHIGGLLAGAALGLGFQSELFSPTRRPAEGAVTASAAMVIAILAMTAALTVFSALRPLPIAAPRLATSSVMPGSLPVPAGWRVGRLHERRCAQGREGREVPSEAPWCFVDPYESLLIVGRGDAIFPAQDDLVTYLHAARHPEPPVERSTDVDTLFIVPAGEGLTYVLVCYPELADRYRPLAKRLFERLLEGVPEGTRAGGIGGGLGKGPGYSRPIP